MNCLSRSSQNLEQEFLLDRSPWSQPANLPMTASLTFDDCSNVRTENSEENYLKKMTEMLPKLNLLIQRQRKPQLARREDCAMAEK